MNLLTAVNSRDKDGKEISTYIAELSGDETKLDNILEKIGEYSEKGNEINQREYENLVKIRTEKEKEA